MYCADCGQENADTAKFCSACGTAVSTPQAVSQDVPAEKQEYVKYGWVKVIGALFIVGFIVWFSFPDPANLQSSQKTAEYCQEVAFKYSILVTNGNEKNAKKIEYLEKENKKCWEDSMKAMSDSIEALQDWAAQ